MAEDMHSSLLLQSPIPILVLSRELKVVLANRAFLDMSGYDESEVLGAVPPYPWWGHGEEDVPVPTVEDQKVLYMKGVSRLERRYVGKGGSSIWIELSVTPITGIDGIRSYLLSMVDVTDRRVSDSDIKDGDDPRLEALERAYAALQQELAERSEWEERLELEVARRTEELEKSKSFWEALFQESPEGIAFLDDRDRIIQVNGSFCRMFLCEADSVRGTAINDIVGKAPGIQIDAERMTRKLFSGEAFVYDTYRTRTDGTVVPVSIHASPFRFGNKTFAYCGYRDITERKRDEERLRYHSTLQNLLSRVSYRFVFPSNDIDGALRQALEDFGSFFRASHCNLIQFGPDGEVVRSIWWHGIPMAPGWDHFTENFSSRDIPWLWNRLHEDDVVMIANEDAIPARACMERRLFDLLGGGEVYVYPLFIRGELSGMISLIRSERDDSGSDKTTDFYVFSSIISAALERHEGERSIKANYEVLHRTFESSIKTMGEMLAVRDPYTARHQRNVAVLSDMISERLGMDEERRKGLRIAALVHDLGKIRVPAEILNKPGQLSDLEFEIIKEHPQLGEEILSNIEFPWPVATIVSQHHERLDGSGYPRHLGGGEILLEARILAVADVVEAMTSHRPYRAGLGLSAALDEIRRGRGSLYDPDAVGACLDVLEGRSDLDDLFADQI
ncbi:MULTISPECIES: HD domain-containing phosphohydrolase [Dethiosulfovibrio]|uniref:PAS domain S-box protein n=2 Tax=Dethiosulfovibrio TaxID=47054 RepID=A0ABS9EPT4_9BACT|nr:MULTISPECIES: HD domain-containing phosphohydrolase [Dethiosulfovibrio]MCF4114801.1 PAS domain S-box protein [Dethiosulfovibrio russensis]MCF4143198.1 PAS domain S-box protein [Dethiosulfovibrio marinus]MCF4145306.1 PAS domain S-box protein [Dethiosulfovibrio acidaminovorans]